MELLRSSSTGLGICGIPAPEAIRGMTAGVLLHPLVVHQVAVHF